MLTTSPVVASEVEHQHLEALHGVRVSDLAVGCQNDQVELE